MRLIDADALLDRLPKVDLDYDEKITRSGAIMDMICIVDTAPTVEIPRWIPVTERLPEKAGEYLVVFHFNYGGIPRKNEVYVGLDSFRGKTTWAKRDNRTVTHWMPLPEPPEVETDGETHEKV